MLLHCIHKSQGKQERKRKKKGKIPPNRVPQNESPSGWENGKICSFLLYFLLPRANNFSYFHKQYVMSISLEEDTIFSTLKDYFCC